MKAVKRKDWPFAGPNAACEVLKSVLSTGMELPVYLQHWEQLESRGSHSDPQVCCLEPWVSQIYYSKLFLISCLVIATGYSIDQL